MRRFILIAFLSMGAIIPARAQDSCGFGSEDAFDTLAKALTEAKLCAAAAAKMRDCAWGSSADTQQETSSGSKEELRRRNAVMRIRVRRAATPKVVPEIAEVGSLIRARGETIERNEQVCNDFSHAACAMCRAIGAKSPLRSSSSKKANKRRKVI